MFKYAGGSLSRQSQDGRASLSKSAGGSSATSKSRKPEFAGHQIMKSILGVLDTDDIPDIEELSQRIAAAQIEDQEAANRIEKVRRSNADLLQQLERVNRLNKLSEELKTVKEERDQAVSEATRLQSDNQELKKERDNLGNENAHLQQRLKDLDDNYVVLIREQHAKLEDGMYRTVNRPCSALKKRARKIRWRLQHSYYQENSAGI